MELFLVVSATDGPMPQTREHILWLARERYLNGSYFMNKGRYG